MGFLRVVDLFCGMGGFTVGAKQAAGELGLDLRIEFACEIDRKISGFYKENNNGFIKKFGEGDISDFEIPIEASGVDFLFAGPPCQGHSDLNNSSRRNDPRNLLYLEVIRFINSCAPKAFIIENVPSVIHSKQNVVGQSIEKLKNDYFIYDFVVDFSVLGIAQTRKRHILVGVKQKKKINFSEYLYASPVRKTLRDTIWDLRDINPLEKIDSPSKMGLDNRKRAEYLVSNDLYDLPNHMRPICHQSEHSYKSMYGRLNWDKPAQTITSGFGSMGQGRFLHPDGNRVLTPHEAARIQGLPDSLNYSMISERGILQKMIGNAVPPVLSKEFVKYIWSYNE